MFVGYDYVLLGLLVVSALIVLTIWRRWWMTHLILGCYLLILFALGLHRSLNALIVWLHSTPEQVGIFMISYWSFAVFFTHIQWWFVWLIVGFLWWQMMYGSSFGALSHGTMTYRLRNTLQTILSVIIVRILCMVTWSWSIFFTTALWSWSDATFYNPIIRQIVYWLPGILALHVLFTITATTTFSRFINISLSMGSRWGGERDAIYVEREDSTRHIVE